MLAIDVALLVGLIALGVGAVGLIGWRRRQRHAAERRRMALREKGAENAKKAEIEEELVCVECGKPINPDTDLYIGSVKNGAWWHRKCYRGVIAS